MVRNRALQRCCGAGGGVKAGIPDLALDCAKMRVKDGEEVSAEIMASTCPFCRRNIMDGENDAKVRHKGPGRCGADGSIHGTGYDHPRESLHQVPGAGCAGLRPSECKLDTVERKEPGKDLVGEAH